MQPVAPDLRERTAGELALLVDGLQGGVVAISMAAVFFGSLTYIGNAPNFMVKNIAIQSGVEMPHFIEYIYKYSMPVLIPLFVLIWWLFFT